MKQLCISVLSALFVAFAWMNQSANAEELHLGVSQDTIAITSSFNGTSLVIFGSVEGGDKIVQATTGYDVVVVLEGPEEPVSIRSKERILGIWVNANERRIDGLPGSYSVATTRPIDEIANSVTTE